MPTCYTLETINKFISLCASDDPSYEDKYFVHNIELELASALHKDFDTKQLNRLAKILLAITD